MTQEPVKRIMLETVNGLPPNYDAIVARLPEAATDGVMFAYAGKVYGRGIAKVLTRELDAHERVHIERQGADPDGWWDKYLADTTFRYIEELLAHRAEYKMYCARRLNQFKRHKALVKMAKRLSSPLYGAGVTLDKAIADINPWAVAKLPNQAVRIS